MWTRKELKQKGKKAFLVNYWKAVLVSLIFAMIAGGIGGGAYGRGHGHNHESIVEEYRENAGELKEGFTEGVHDALEHGLYGGVFENEIPWQVFALVSVLITIIVLIVVAIGLLINIFIFNPLEVGCRRFFTRNLNQQATISEIAYAFDHNYINVVKVLFFRDLFNFLWLLLFIIPGIVKAYEYRMIPYLLTEHPEMTREEAFARSKALMDGNKWKAFVLDLSFLGWEILSLFTAGILHILYVGPYRDMTSAALYEKLEYKTPDDGDVVCIES